MLVLLALAACWTPQYTGPRSMVGHVVDTNGQPVVGLEVESLESRWITDDQGFFAANYKDPNQYVHLTHEGLWYKRSYTPSDDDTNVQIQLVPTEQHAVQCAVTGPCRAQITWRLSDVLVARQRFDCGKKPAHTLTVPAGVEPAEVICKTPVGQPDTPMALVTRDDPWVFTSAGRQATFELASDAQPSHCAYAVDGQPVMSDDGIPQGEILLGSVVTALCDGIPARPEVIAVPLPSAVALEWTDTPSQFDLTPVRPATSSATLRRLPSSAETSDAPEWSLDLPVGSDSRLALPPLHAGAYDLLLDVTEPPAPAPIPEQPVDVWTPQTLEGGGLRLTLRLSRDGSMDRVTVAPVPED